MKYVQSFWEKVGAGFLIAMIVVILAMVFLALSNFV